MEIRPCLAADCQAICDIYNYYIENTVVSFEESPLTTREMARRVKDCTADYPWLVGVEGGQLVGYAYANRWQVRCAYRKCVETTIYLRAGKGGKGFGKALYQQLLTRLQQQGLHMAIAGIALPNDASVKLHEQCGFGKAAHFREVGWKFDRWVDVGYWQKNLGGS